MERRHDLDWVRVCAFGLLVLYHVGMYYVSWDWHVKSPQAGEALEPFMMLTSPWRLSLLFVVSGAATAFLLGKSPKGFLGARSWRLLVPVIFGMLVIVPPQSYYEVLDSGYPGGYQDGYLAFWGRYLRADSTFCDSDGCLLVPTWNHLWFVVYLWVYTAAVWLVAKLAPQAWPKLSAGLARALSGWGALVWPVLLLAATRMALVARFEQTHALVDDWYNHAQYFSVFLIGFLMARTAGFWESLQRLRWVSLAAAAVSYVFVIWYFFGSGYSDANPAPDGFRVFQRSIWALNQWTTIAAIFGFAYRFRNADNAALRYLTPAVFPVYILHQTVTVIAAYQLRPLSIPPLAEGLLLIALTYAVCFAGYEIVRRIGVLRPLFGLKRRRSTAVADGVAPQSAT